MKQHAGILREQLRGYAITKATPRQVQDEPSGGVQTNAVIQRCFVDGILGSRRFALQRGLARIHFEPTTALRTLRMPLEEGVGGRSAFKDGFNKEQFKEAYTWATSLVKGIESSLDRRFGEVGVWQAVKALVDPAVWRSDEF